MAHLLTQCLSMPRRIAALTAGAASLAASLAIAGPPAATVTPTDFFPIDYVGKHLVAYASGANSPSDRAGIEVSGTVALKLSLSQDRHDAPVAFTTEKIVYLIDGLPVSGVLSSPYTFNWNSASVSDGSHVLSALLVDGPADLETYRVEPSVLIVDNGAAPRTAMQRVPALGGGLQSLRLNSATPDWVVYPGGVQPPHPVSRPWVHKTVPPASSLADPSRALVQDNWVLEPLTQAISGLYATRPRYFKTLHGHVVVKQVNTQSGSSSEGAEPLIASHAHYDGPRNDNSVSMYSTIVPEPGGSNWLGIDLIGRLFRVFGDGSVITLAGDVTRRDVLPLDKNDPTVTPAARRAAQVETRGSFAGGLAFSMPTDLAIDPRNANIVYVADSAHHRIAKVDLSKSPVQISTYVGNPAVAGLQDGSSATATLHQPWSLVMAADGTLYVADKAGNAIRKVSPDGGTVSTVANGAQGIVAPFVIRLDSNGRIILSETTGATVKRVDPVTKAVTVITTAGCNSEWLWLDVDRKGNVGPKDDILLICGTGGGGNTDMKRIAADGSRNALVLNGSGPANLGALRIVQDAHGHYPWVVAIDDEEARILSGGFGNMGLNMLRMKLGTDATPETTSGTFQSLYGLGQEIFRRGTVKGFPFGARPSFNSLLSSSGHGYLGLKNFDDLEGLSDADLTTYIQSGLGGSVPRPEITGMDLRALIYYIRFNMPSSIGTLPVPMAAPSDRTAASVSDVTVTPLDATSARVQWTTSEPTLGFVAFGPHLAYHRWTELESSYGTSHSAVLTFLPQGKPIHYAIRAKDAAGNHTLTADQTFTTSGSTTPAPTLSFSATPASVAPGGSALLSWTASNASACSASGGWSQAVAVSGSATQTGLSADTTYTLSCTGTGGQVSRSVTVTLTAPPPAPTLAITSPAAGAHLTGTSLTVHHTRGGSQANVDHVVLQLDASPPVSSTATSHTFTGVAVGPHTVKAWLATASNAKIAGTEAQVQVIFDVVPTAAPTLSITSPSSGSHTTESTLTVGWSRGGDPAGIDHVELQLDNGAVVSTTSNSHLFTDVPVGAHTVRVWLATADGSPIAGTEVTVTVTRDEPAAPPPPSGGGGGSSGGIGSGAGAGAASGDSTAAGGCTLGNRDTKDPTLPLAMALAGAALAVRRFKASKL